MINSIVLMGRLTADPVLSHVGNDIAKAECTLAVERAYKREAADFIDVIAWRGTAEFLNKYFKKGQMIALTGSVQTGSYTDREGIKRKSFKVVADNLSFCGGKSESGPKSADDALTPPQQFEAVDFDDDLPF